MTTLNLISPRNGDAFNYNVRFREPITLEKNSKIYLNYAHLVRENEIIFTENQTITLSDMEFQPSQQLGDPLQGIALTTNTIIIPAVNPATNRRGYKVEELEKEIRTKLAELVTNNSELSIYSLISRLDANRDQNTFLAGLFLDDDFTKLPIKEFELLATHQRNAEQVVDANGDAVAYRKSNANPAGGRFYDNYAISNHHFFHFASECMGNNSQIVSGTFLRVKTNIHMNAQQGNISFGLYSREVAEHPTAFTSWAEKTTGGGANTQGGTKSNPAVFRGTDQRDATTQTEAQRRNCVLGSFLTIEITGINNAAVATSQLRILVPSRTTAVDQKIMEWPNIDQNIKRMISVFRTPLRNVFDDLDQEAELLLVSYIPTTDLNYLNKDERRIYFKLYKGTEQDLSTVTPIYDSKQDDVYFPQSFFTGFNPTELNIGTAAEKKARTQSAIPFSVIASAQEQHEGFYDIQFKSIDKTNGGAATDAKPVCILANYKMNFSENLANFVGANISPILYPNVCEMDARFFYFENVIESWKNDSFDIILDGLPIRNFKNTEEKSDGGFAKPLLCSVPVPFLNGNSAEGMGANTAQITGLYEPSIKSELKLRNQKTTFNNISVKINDTGTEKPSESIQSAHISLTIDNDE